MLPRRTIRELETWCQDHRVAYGPLLDGLVAVILRSWPSDSLRYKHYPHLNSRRWERAQVRGHVVMILTGAVATGEELHAYHWRRLDEEMTETDGAERLTKGLARIATSAERLRRPWPMLTAAERASYRLEVAITLALAPDGLEMP